MKVILTRSAIALSTILLACSAAVGQSEIVLHAFGALPDGSNPRGGLIADSAGRLYGLTYNGGHQNLGVVYEIVPPSTKGGAWTEYVLYSLAGLTDSLTDSYDTLALGSHGELYATTFYSGTLGYGSVAQVVPPAKRNGKWTGSMIYSFTGGTDGAYPEGGVVFDKSGALYGTTIQGGNRGLCDHSGCGTVFQLVPPVSSGGAWTENTLYTFSGFDGNGSPGQLLWDRAGNLYGISEVGGAYAHGNVFELSPPAVQGGSWSLADLYDFTGGADGNGPVGSLVWDPAGNLYGMTVAGGDLSACSGGGCGTVFQLSPPATQGGSWSETALYSFTGQSNGYLPLGGVIRDGSGNLYGTTYFGGDPLCDESGSTGCGVVFKLAPPAVSGGTWTETTLHSFLGGTDGADPSSGVTFGKGNALYGTTFLGGSSAEYGTVFEVTPLKQCPITGIM